MAAFVWGDAGAQMTPDQIAAQRKVAQAMLARGSDYSPVKSAWQGAARVAEGLMGGFESGRADVADRANQASERELILKGLSAMGGGVSPSPVAAAPAPVQVASLGQDVPAATAARPSVLPSSRVWGDKEAEAAGLYETPVAKVAAAMPGPQPVAASPAVRSVAAAQGGVNPALVQMATSPYVSDQTRAMGLQMLQAQMKPRDQWIDERDPSTGSFYQRNALTGERKVIEKSDVLPQLAVDQKIAIAKGGKPETTVNVGGGSDKQVFDSFAENTKEARAAATGLTALRTARQSLQGPGGAITGFGADERLTLQKIGSLIGATNPAAIQNTETFRAAIAPQVAATLKNTVGSANISNSDRDFAERASGGSIKLDAGSITRLLDIMERAGKARLDLHQEQLESVYPDPVAHRRERALFGVKMPEAPQANQVDDLLKKYGGK